MDANVNEQSRGRHDRHFKARHGQAQQWDVTQSYPYDHTSSFILSFVLFFFFTNPMLLQLLVISHYYMLILAMCCMCDVVFFLS